MAFKKNAAKRRKTAKLKRYKQPMDQTSVHKFTRCTTTNYQNGNALGIVTSALGYPQWKSGAVANENLSMSFNLNGVTVYIGGTQVFVATFPNNTDFTNLFDNYRIDRISMWALPSFDGANVISSAAGAISAQQLPWFVHAVDYDDIASTGSVGLMQYDNARFTQLEGNRETMLRSFVPRSQTQVAAAGGTVGYRPTKLSWIDSASPAVDHFGFKMAIDNSSQANVANQVIGSVNFIVKYHISCRNVK